MLNSVYSSYEHSLLTSVAPTTSKSPTGSSTGTSTNALPIDIVVETLFSTLLLLFGLVLGSPPLRPIQWAAWAGEAEKDRRRLKGKKRFEGDAGSVGMGWLEERRGFWNVRGQRRDFAEWVRKGGDTGLKGDSRK
jgi:hypothetical protein